ncbi:lectin C-type domain-containing protein [Clathrospora elynae]|uniref:Maintenance of telomere capping protein 6 n=1 Tax=Clathrospora elynae TaxID=706981 RepID=A0A6A5SBG9_9PLEO|nr:lectin C-type domain-containing protein [Clathrospora elynae]
MSGNSLYDPDQAAVDTRWIQPWSEAFRAQRDVGLRVPINFHTVPAVALTQACFSSNQYAHNAFQKCFSNLLAVGFRQFTVDTYWDPLRSVWSLCPVELPRSNAGDDNVPVQTKAMVVASSDTGIARIPESTAKPIGQSLAFEKRQETPVPAPISAGSSSVATAMPSSSTASLTSAAGPTVVSFPSTSGPPLLQIGSYNCTSLMTLDLLTGILENFLDSTATTTGAALIMFTFDVHAASSISNPDAPAPNLSQDQLPESGQLLSDVLRGNVSDDTYTPSRLQNQRANLNNSWYGVDRTNRPLQGYYEDAQDANGHLFTHDGWPTESFMEFQELFRLVSSYGTIDTQMRLYNIGPDLDYVFPPGTLMSNVNTTTDTVGRVSSGCLFAATDNTITSQRNSSWTITSAPSLNISANPDLMVPIASVANLMSCGLTPVLNEVPANTTADKNPLPYAAYVHSTLWTWAPGEPMNATRAGSGASGNRCVVMTTSPYAGRWRVTDCGDRHRVACQDPTQPYNWQVSSEGANYTGADGICQPPYQFSIPHTALENAHLLAAFQSHRQSVPDDDTLFINLNSLNTPDCWVVGLNGTCPYLATTDTNRTRIVVVPTVAAVIIFVLAGLTFFVKCAANRREDKRGRQRRMVGGWEYEGVPS